MSMLKDIQAAIESEIKAQRRARHSFWITIDRIDLLRESVGHYIYRLEFSQALRIVSDTELAIKVPGHKDVYTVKVIVSDGEALIVASNTLLPQQMSLVRFQFDPTFILKHLAADLAAVFNPPSPLLQALLTRALPLARHADDGKMLKRIQARAYGLNSLQRAAVLRMQADDVHVLWGPPGTGKTSTLGVSIAEHLGSGKTCLLLSTSNAAVDEMVKAAAPHVGVQALTNMFRAGVSADAQVELLTAVGHFKRQNPTLAAQAEQAQSRLKELTTSLRSRGMGASSDTALSQMQSCKAIITAYAQAAKEYGDDILAQSQCVAATLASLVINPHLAKRSFDVVYIDEASMVALPFAFAGAARAQQHLIFAGDFQQLPPVCHATDTKTTDWFARNIFSHLGMVQLARGQAVPPYVSMLREQYRMTTTIADLVSHLSYGGRLVSGQGIQVGVRPLFINVAGSFGTSHYSVETKSYYHPYSALVLQMLSQKFPEWMGPRNLLLSPFRAQQALLSAVAKDISTAQRQFEARTIHKAQGTQEDTVIVDLTAHDASNPQRFFRDEEAENLINVALSRAQQRLIIIGNLEMIRDLARHGGYWARFWTLAEAGCTHVTAHDILAFALSTRDIAHGLRTLGAESDAPELPAVYVESVASPCPADVEVLFRNNHATTKLLVRRKHSGIAPTGITQRHDRYGTVPPLAVAHGVLALPVLNGAARGRWKLAHLPETTKQLLFLACGHLLDGRFDVQDTLRLQCGRCGYGLLLKQQYGASYLVCSHAFECSYSRPLSVTDARVLIETHGIRCPVCHAQAQVRRRQVDGVVFIGCSNYPVCDGKIDITLYVEHR